jgi:hypothetical protein
MAHDHSHDDPKTYYVEQLCTIGIAGALGGIAFMLWQRGLLYFIAPKVRPWVLGGGVALLVLVAMRAVVVWFQAGRAPAADHDHDHEHDHAHGEACDHHHHDAIQAGTSLTAVSAHSHGAACGHDHDHDHDHGHDHTHNHDDDGHTHGWAPWRYVILLLPVVLYFLDLPNESMAGGDDRDAVRQVGNIDLQGMGGANPEKAVEVSFTELQHAPMTPDSRKAYEGKRVRIKGECLPVNDQTFTLVRYKMNCCAKDAIPLKAIIWVDRRSDDTQEKNRLHPEALRRHWVEVEGQLHFQPQPDGTWMTVVVVRPDDQHVLFDPKGEDATALVKITKPEGSYYLY